MPDKLELGDRIKRCRLDRNLTLKEVEQKAKVSATHVSEIERGMTSPTVGALARIARALETEPAHLVQVNDGDPAVVVRKDERRRLMDEGWGATLSVLGRGSVSAGMSVLEVELSPSQAGRSLPITHAGEEFVHVLSGVVEVQLGLDRILLRQGDSLHFKGGDPHRMRCVGENTATLLWIASPPFCL